MTVIEGIGDEVVQFFSVLFVVALAVAAWWSTSVRESHGRNIRTVLILERRTRGRAGPEPRTPSPAAADADPVDTGQRIDPNDGVETEILTDDSQDKDEAEATNGESEAADSGEDPESASGAAEGPQGTLLRKRIGPFLKAQAATLLKEPAPGGLTGEETEASQESDSIRVRLKYLNEEQKLVQGRLQEQLGEFKRRNFTVELAADKLVRLIFNGQVLGSDARTLQAYGLYDNCVVHCLVHAQRHPPAPPPSSAATPGQPAAAPERPPPHPDWNLSAVLYSCLSAILCLAWYCRYQYAQLFTLTTTAALVGLTGIFTVSVFSLYLPDQDGIPN